MIKKYGNILTKNQFKTIENNKKAFSISSRLCLSSLSLFLDELLILKRFPSDFHDFSVIFVL